MSGGESGLVGLFREEAGLLRTESGAKGLETEGEWWDRTPREKDGDIERVEACPPERICETD